MNIKFLDSFETVGEQAWNALVAKSPTNTIFQTWAWQRAWWHAHACSGRELRLVAVYDGPDLRVLMPLVLEARILSFIGQGSADRIDLIYDGARSADLLALLLPLKNRDDWDEMDLALIPDASPTWRYLKIMAEEAGLFPLSMGKYPLWGLRLEGREDRIRRFLHTGVLAKHASIFASKGQVFADHQQAPVPSSLPWKEFFIQHIHRWTLRVDPSLFVSRSQRDFFRNAAQDPSLNPGMVFTRLDLNNKPAGYHLGFMYDGVFYACMSSFDISLKRFSPDDVLWREMVAYALAQECREIVFVSPEERAVKHFSDRTGTARMVRIFRSRRIQWQAIVGRWVGKVPLAANLALILHGIGSVAVALFQRRKIVQEARRKIENVDSFKTLYAQKLYAGGGQSQITRPEIDLLRRLRPELKETRMLDMGVGTGRTGIYFASAVRSYHGFDHAPEMVGLAREYLKDQVSPENIFLADGANISFAQDGSYDLVCFSGEGIDEVSPQDRIKVLKEVHRVGREGAWFCFSSRNLQSLRPWAGSGVVDFLRRLRRRLLISVMNPGLSRFQHQASAMIMDETGGYRLAAYYGTPKEQVRVLKELGFHDLRVLSTRTGLEVRDWRRWDKLIDDTLYYLCRV